MWFAGKDHLAGTFEIGTQGKDDDEWAILFGTLKFDSYLIATGNFRDWMVVPKDFITTPGTTFTKRSTTSSSRSSAPMDVLVKNDPSSDDEPKF